MIYLSGDVSKLEVGFFAFLFFFIIFSLIHITTFLDESKSPTVEIRENKIIIGKPN
jgi:hypothetical protein